jgi:hypothetical protein
MEVVNSPMTFTSECQKKFVVKREFENCFTGLLLLCSVMLAF